MAKAWRKVLWEMQDFGDDHVDEKFLDELSKNENVKPPTFYFLSGCSVAVTQQLSAISIFWVFSFSFCANNLTAVDDLRVCLCACLTEVSINISWSR